MELIQWHPFECAITGGFLMMMLIGIGLFIHSSIKLRKKRKELAQREQHVRNYFKGI